MKNDVYTKLILTVIAICLVWICLRDISISRSTQANAPQPVIVTGVAPNVETPVVIRGIELTDPGSQRLTRDKVLPVYQPNLR
jgi:hypothetical protein